MVVAAGHTTRVGNDAITSPAKPGLRIACEPALMPTPLFR